MGHLHLLLDEMGINLSFTTSVCLLSLRADKQGLSDALGSLQHAEPSRHVRPWGSRLPTTLQPGFSTHEGPTPSLCQPLAAHDRSHTIPPVPANYATRYVTLVHSASCISASFPYSSFLSLQMECRVGWLPSAWAGFRDPAKAAISVLAGRIITEYFPFSCRNASSAPLHALKESHITILNCWCSLSPNGTWFWRIIQVVLWELHWHTDC